MGYAEDHFLSTIRDIRERLSTLSSTLDSPLPAFSGDELSKYASHEELGSPPSVDAKGTVSPDRLSPH